MSEKMSWIRNQSQGFAASMRDQLDEIPARTLLVIIVDE